MKISSNKLFEKSFFTVIIVIVTITIMTLYSIHSIYKDKEKSFYNEKINSLQVAYTSNIHKYKLLTKWIYEEYINTEEILSLVHYATQSQDRNQIRYYRGLLYQNLSKKYEKLAKYNIRQLHFHDKNNHSFLRFHKPCKFGDDLTCLRPSITLANLTKKTINAFETGRVVSGFRNVFALHYKGKHLGSVEISATTEAILETLSVLDKTKNYRFILNKNIVFPKLFEKQERLYSPSLIHQNFVFEDASKLLIKHNDYNYAFDNDVKKINKILSTDKKLQLAIDDAKPYGTTIKYKEGYQTIIFLPMLGINGTHEGYLISYEKEKNIPYILTKVWTLYFIVLVGATIFILLMFLLKWRSDTINNQKVWFKTIMNTLNEGLYVMDKNGIITFINDSACTLLGYKKDELIGKEAHSTFHAHKVKSDLSHCPIYMSTLNKKVFNSEKEHFIKKDKTLFPIVISSAPLLKKGKVDEIVSTFKDISSIKKAHEKMQMLTTALESSMNAVVVTDINAKIEWINPAFEKMTGYKINEVLGKKPKEIISSGKQSKEFYVKLWESILAKKAWKGELVNKRKNGTLYYEELSITPVLDEEGEIKHFIAIKQDISLRKDHEKNIEFFAFYDALTHLPNRRLFMDRLQNTLAQMKRNPHSCGLIFLDLDKFKNINDTHGHEAGDVVLQVTAKRLKKLVREHDTVARLGGDEFVIIISYLDFDINLAQKNMQRIAENICENIRLPFDFKDIKFNLSISVGAYIFQEKEPIKSLFRNADQALYKAKARGRDTYFISTQK